MCRRTKGCDRMNHKSKKRWPRKLVAFMACMACMALAFSMVPVGALAAFGESEAMIEALNIVRNTDVKIAKEAPVEQEGDKAEKSEAADKAVVSDEKDAALTTQSEDTVAQENQNNVDADVNIADTDASSVGDGTAPVEKVDSISAQAEGEGAPVEEENTLSDKAKAFMNAHDAAVAASENDDENELRKQVNLAKELYAALDPAEQEEADIAQMWTAVQNFDKNLPEEEEVVDPIATIGDTGYETLQAALSAAADGATITLSKDFELSTYVSINKSVTLNLNGKTITESGDHVIAIAGGSVTISNGNIALSAGSGTYALSVTGGSLALQGVSVNGTGASGLLASGGALVVNDGTSINCANGSGIRVINGAQATMNGGSVNAQNGVFIANQGSAFTMNDGQITGSQFGIVGNGQSQYAGTTINIKGGSVSSATYNAIYHPQAGTLNVTGGSVQGPLGGIGIKSGTLNISGGSVAGTSGAGYDDTIGSYGNGIMVAGSAIHVDSRSGYAGNLSINISGGTLSSANGYAIHEVSEGSSQISSVSVTGGHFSTALDTFRFNAASSGVISVSGGVFNRSIPEQYCAEGYVSEQIEGTGEYSVKPRYVEHSADQCEWDDGYVTTLPTCSQPGVRTYTCAIGGETKTEPEPTAGCDWEFWEHNDPTCTTPGQNIYYCSRDSDCDGQYIRVDDIESEPALGHDYDEWNYNDATCEEGAYRIRFCYREYCDKAHEFADDQYYELEYTSEPAGHKWTVTETKAATCTEDGSQTVVCDVCGKTETTTLSATGHAYGNYIVTKDATCTEQGVSTSTCANCGDTQEARIDALGHKEVAVADKAATCTETGYEGRTECSVCHEVVNAGTEIAMLEHKLGNGVTQREATCTTDGLITFSCPDCGVEVSTERIPAKGHAEITRGAIAATCEAAGSTGDKVCQDCDVIITAASEIPALGHDYVNNVCSVCGASEPQSIETPANDNQGGNNAPGSSNNDNAPGSSNNDNAPGSNNGNVSGSNNGNGPTADATDYSGGPSANEPGNGGAVANGATAVAGNGSVSDNGETAADQDGTNDEGEQIDDEFTPLASLNTVKQSNDEIDWMLVGIAGGAFVIVDGLAIGAFLVWRRRKMFNL